MAVRRSGPDAPHSWRVRAGRLLTKYRLPLLAGLAVVSLVLGYVGLTEKMAEGGQPFSPSDVIYRVIPLFVFGGGTVEPPTPWQLNVARFLAPLVLASATILGLLRIFDDQVGLLRIRRYKGHVVVVGLGRVGTAVASSLHARGYQVAAIERDPSNPDIRACRAAGIPVVVGSGDEKEVLVDAGLRQAAYLFAMTGDDVLNATVTRVACSIADTRQVSGITSFLKVDDAVLAGVLDQFALGRFSKPRFRLESFWVAGRAASALLDEHPLLLDADGDPRSHPHLLLVGADSLLSEVLVLAARRWHGLGRGAEDRLTVTVIDGGASAFVADLEERYPRMREVCDLRAVDLSPSAAGFVGGSFNTTAGPGAAITLALVRAETDSAGVTAAIRLRQGLRSAHGGDTIPIVVCVESAEGGLVGLLHPQLEDVGDALRSYRGIELFGVLEAITDPDGLLLGMNERLARGMHRQYTLLARSQAATTAERPAMVPWTALKAEDIESNRSAAADIGRKLEQIHCDVEPMDDWDATPLEFTDAEIESLAELEHQRWADRRVACGWTWGPERDQQRLKHPDIRPYADLLEGTKDFDRDQVRHIPGLLYDLGFRVVRRSD